MIFFERWERAFSPAMKSGGGGGGSSGKVDYPEYMKTYHGNLLGTGEVTTSMTALMDSAVTSSPFLTAQAFNPNTYVTDMLSVAGVAWTNLLNLDVSSTVNSIIAKANQQLNDTLLPEFRSGARDLGIVLSSAFAYGESLIVSRMAQETAAVTKELTVKKTELMQNALQLQLEARRMAIVANKEYSDQNVSYDEADARWPFEVYTFGGNLLAAIQGGAIQPGAAQPSTTQSVLGGALSGASMGSGGGGVGMLAGGILGGLGGLFG